MDEYIKREDVLEILRQKQRDICPVGRCGHGYVYGRDRDEFDAIEADIDTIENIPADDVAPVVHGKWKRIDYKPCGHDYVCSACNQMNDRASHYCPDCGAKMDL